MNRDNVVLFVPSSVSRECLFPQHAAPSAMLCPKPHLLSSCWCSCVFYKRLLIGLFCEDSKFHFPRHSNFYGVSTTRRFPRSYRLDSGPIDTPLTASIYRQVHQYYCSRFRVKQQTQPSTRPVSPRCFVRKRAQHRT